MTQRADAVDLATDWERSDPDIVVYVPKGGDLNDTDNEHFLVFEAPKSDELLALWTQSSCEGRGDNHLVLARSTDGATWSEPVRIVGTAPGGSERQASWGFPVVSARGRIYVFYTKEVDRYDNSRQGSGAMGCLTSDDNGRIWTPGADIPMPRNRLDHPDPTVPRNWIVWQKPVRDSAGRWLAGYTQCSSHAVVASPDGWWTQDSRCAFMRFENIDDSPRPEEICVTWLPVTGDGLEVPHRNYPELSTAQEPSVVLLPDGRLFTTMRTMEGHVWYSVSEDDGERWRAPDVLRFRDGGEGIKHPLSCCPIYAMSNGRFLLLFHNNDGIVGDHSQYEKKWRTNHLNFIRNPMFVAVGSYRPEARQPIWFGEPYKLFDTNDIPVGPKGTAEIATYTSVTEWHGTRVLWYPDRKYYLLGKRITDEFMAGLA